MTPYLQTIDPVSQLLRDHDHFDVKTVEGEVSLRAFIAGALTFFPAWIRALYGVRAGLVRLLGMRQPSMQAPRLTPETVPFTAGRRAFFFEVVAAQENSFWIASASEQHLDAYLVIACETLPTGHTRFHVGTVVKYNNWAGPIYFNLIRPFHHLVVRQMMLAGLRPAHAPA